VAYLCCLFERLDFLFDFFDFLWVLLFFLLPPTAGAIIGVLLPKVPKEGANALKEEDNLLLIDVDVFVFAGTGTAMVCPDGRGDFFVKNPNIPVDVDGVDCIEEVDGKYFL